MMSNDFRLEITSFMNDMLPVRMLYFHTNNGELSFRKNIVIAYIFSTQNGTSSGKIDAT